MCTELDPHAASCAAEEVRGAGLLISFTPVNRNAARIAAIIAGDGVVLELGQGSRAELDVADTDPSVEDVCRAVIEGHLQEEIFVRGDRVIGVRGRLRLPSGDLRLWSNAYFPLTVGATRHRVRYESYV